MTFKTEELALIERALADIEHVLARASDNEAPVPFYGATQLGELPPEEREALLRIEMESYRANPSDSAIHFCLRAASALLDVSHSLLTQDADATLEQREAHLKRLVAHSKTAGRAAYRAALILMDAKRQ